MAQALEQEDISLSNRNHLMDSISKKKVSFKYLDIFTLLDPPPKYRVRDVDEDFIGKLADSMIEKKSVSLHNAPNIIGMIDIDRSEYREENFSQYSIYVLDGNHSIKAQKEAFYRTNDPLFKSRGVNIYCGLTENEALLLGISRNEDTSNFVKFSDYQKVTVLRRRLYMMTNTPESCDPPQQTKAFKSVFASLLNLQTVSLLMLLH